MDGYYTGQRASLYNRRWRVFTERTLAEAMVLIDIAALHRVQAQSGRAPRVLDAACGTGLLLKHIIGQLPEAEAFGVDASADMLAQAASALRDQPRVHLAQVAIGSGETARLPYSPQTFDLITCTNVLHDLLEPGEILTGLCQLLTPGGQLVLEDFARRGFPFPWKAFEWLVQRIEGSNIYAYTLDEARSLCVQAGFRVIGEKAFVVDWLWHGWALSMIRSNRTGQIGTL